MKNWITAVYKLLSKISEICDYENKNKADKHPVHYRIDPLFNYCDINEYYG